MGMIEISPAQKPILMLYRHAVDYQDPAPAEVEVMAVVQDGAMQRIRCSICGKARTWAEFAGGKGA
jgi:uncharacterized protein CbrC (UPF0167 family)